MPKIITGYFVIKATIEVPHKTDSKDEVLQHVSSQCDYSLALNDEVCKVIDTELVDVCPKHPAS